MKRREFVKYSFGSILATPLLYSWHRPLYAEAYASPVVSVYDKKVSDLGFREGGTLNSDGVIVDKILNYDLIHTRAARMVDTAVMKLTNQSSVGKAWESLFPAGHPNRNTKIGIKLNFSYGDWKNDVENDWSKLYCPFGPKSAVTDAIITGLSQMMDGTFPVENITLIERMYSVGKRQFYPLIQGYRPIAPDSQGLYIDKQSGACNQHWVYATNPLELPPEAPHFIAAPDYPEPYQAPQRIYKAVYSNDFLINYAIAKDHREAGITGSMKNNYGCTDNPVGTHGNVWMREDSPYAGTRLCVPAFYKNINENSPYLVNILDAITGIYQGGPLSGNVFQTNTLAVSQDPVALDTYLLNMINKARKGIGISEIGTSNSRTPEGHPNASFLPIASENHELGSMSLKDIQSFDLSSHAPENDLPTLQNPLSRISEVRRTNDRYQVQVFLDKSKRNHTIESSIMDPRGKIIKSFATQSTVASQAMIEWDHRNDLDKTVNDGIYVWNIRIDGRLHTGSINDFNPFG